MLHTHSFIYHRHCMFFSQYISFPLSVIFHQCSILIHSSTTDTVCFSPIISVFPCQYYSTDAPYSFIHPQTTVYVFLPVLQFPLSVLFHQCSILIHSSTNDTVCFSPSTSVSPVSIIPPMLHSHSFIYHRRCIMFLSQYFSFSPSVSFRQCSILIHWSQMLY
jgi:hypothetical protein